MPTLSHSLSTPSSDSISLTPARAATDPLLAAALDGKPYSAASHKPDLSRLHSSSRKHRQHRESVTFREDDEYSFSSSSSSDDDNAAGHGSNDSKKGDVDIVPPIPSPLVQLPPRMVAPTSLSQLTKVQREALRFVQPLLFHILPFLTCCIVSESTHTTSSVCESSNLASTDTVASVMHSGPRSHTFSLSSTLSVQAWRALRVLSAVTP